MTLTVAVAVAPAAADVGVVHDRAGDGSGGSSGGKGPWGDIGAVRVVHAPRAVHVAVRPAAGSVEQWADFYDVFIDTDRTDPGPEFVASVSTEIDGRGWVSRTERWFGVQREVCTVPATNPAELPDQDGVARLHIPRRCLRTDGKAPRAIRVSVRSEMEYGVADWAPARRTFGRWVHVG